jgi:alkyl sulfatase BDS1-like metallo-beta-lactamase superfamily hydrolase
MRADFQDRADFGNADRGFVASLDPMVIKGVDGRVVWDAVIYTHSHIDPFGGVLGKLIALLDAPDPTFAVVTP